MNRSYSKIRHIQEANQKLEKRILSEEVRFGIGRDERGDLNFEFNDKRVFLKDLTQKKVQYYLSKLPETLEALVIMDCGGADFSEIDICSFNHLSHVNLGGTPSNFGESNDCGFKEFLPDRYKIYY
jgi:hypothetical protein